MKDKEIEELIAQELIQNKYDEKLYQKIYEDLGEEDANLQLSHKFDLSVLDQLKSRRRQIIKEKFWIFFGVIILAFTALIIIAITDAFSLFTTTKQLLIYTIIFFGLYLVFQKVEHLILKS